MHMVKYAYGVTMFVGEKNGEESFRLVVNKSQQRIAFSSSF